MIRDDRGWWWWEYRCPLGHVVRLLVIRRFTYCAVCGSFAENCVRLGEGIAKQDWSPRRDRELAVGELPV